MKEKFKLLEESKILFECLIEESVKYSNKYGFDFSKIHIVENALDDIIFNSSEDYEPVVFEYRKTYHDIKGDFFRYIVASRKEEIAAMNDESDHFYDGYDFESINNRNIALYKAGLKKIEEENKKMQDNVENNYSELESIFYKEIGRAPKELNKVKIAAQLANIDERTTVERFDMKKINMLKKKHISLINIFMFIFKAPWFTLNDINNMSKKDILCWSRIKVSEEYEWFYRYCYDKEGAKRATELMHYLKATNSSTAALIYKINHNKLEQLELKIEEVLDLVSSTKILDIDEILQSKYFEDLKKGNIDINTVIELTKINYDITQLFTPHDLKTCKVEMGNEKCYIMKWDDIRQIMLGEYTHCCQRLGEVGESSMLFGLISPHSGFMAIERNNKILGQAWVWEDDKDTLVLDNIELANCREVNQFKDILYMWVKNSPYKNIQLGLGYSDMELGTSMNSREVAQYYALCDSIAYTDKVSAFFEDRDEAVYTDSRKRNWLKKEGEMQFDKMIDINDTDALAERALRIERLVAEISVTNE